MSSLQFPLCLVLFAKNEHVILVLLTTKYQSVSV